MEFVFQFTGPVTSPFTHSNVATHVEVSFTPEAGGWRAVVPLPAPLYVAREVLAAAAGRGLSPSPAQADWLEEWDHANRQAAAALAAQGQPPAHCPRSKADYWAAYTQARPGLRLAWPSDDIGVAELRLWARRANGQVALVAVLAAEWNSAIWPEADFVVIKRTRLLLPGVNPRGAPAVVLPRTEALAALGQRVQHYRDPVSYVLYRGGDEHPLVLRRLQALPGTPPAEFVPVRHERLVDVP